MLGRENVREALQQFAKEVIRQARGNLTRKNKNVNKSLYDSIGADIETFPNSFELDFTMNEYGQFQDKGVSGTRRKYNTPYSFKNENPSKAHVNALVQWVNKRRLRLRDKETGKFRKGEQRSLAYAIAKTNKRYGIKPSLFFTRAFENAFQHLPEDIEKAYGLDVAEFMEFTFKK